MKLDKWQEEVINTTGNICLRSGRQVGKSTIIGLKAAQFALSHRKKLIMVISKTERQAGLLFAKILANLVNLDEKRIITKGRKRPTKHIINLTNGSTIHCLPCGDTGFGIMGFTIDLLIADEAAWIPEEVWNSIIPALAITKGNIWLLSTPFLKRGYYYECFNDPAFTAFHTSSEDCPRKDQVFLDRQKEVLTKTQYAQMYKGQFVDELLQFFPDGLIEQICKLKRPDYIRQTSNHWIGCDVARMDKDEFTYEIIKEIREDMYHQVESIVTRSVALTTSARRIVALDAKYDFKTINIDSGGMGIAICDMLREEDQTKRKVVEINNASRIYNVAEGKKRLIKEDLYNNLKKMMEQGQLYLLDDKEIKESLKGVQAEHDKDSGRMKIWSANHNTSHIVEGLVRAAYGTKEKSLNIWCAWN